MRSTSLLVATGLLLSVVGCKAAPEPARDAPKAATIEHPRTEDELTKITLSPEAEQRLGIATAPAERREVERTRLYGAEVLLPGALGQQWPVVPTERLRLADAVAAADGEVERARVELEVAKTEQTRVERLLRLGAASARQVEEARARSDTARSALAIAEKRRRLLGGAFSDMPDELWVRVPVSVTDREAIDSESAARIAPLSRAAESTGRPAVRVEGSPSADPDGGAVDLYFKLDNRDRSFRIGEKVGATLELGSREMAIVVPRSALVLDIHGGEWVYERTAPLTYVRRRVEVRTSHGDDVALERGIDADAPVVTQAAAELFGIEFGPGK